MLQICSTGLPKTGNIMGYITNFEFFRCEGAQEDYEALLKDIDDFLDADGDVVNSRCYEGKWYSCETDLADISRKHPGTGFGVAGQGEDPTDRWTAWFLNGKWYMESDDCRTLKWEDAKEQMERPSRIRRAIQRVSDAYGLLLEEVVRAVEDGKRLLEGDEVFGYVYDESLTEMQEMNILDVKVEDGVLYAKMVRRSDVIEDILAGRETTGGEWYAVNGDMYGNFPATIYSIAESIMA